MSPDTQAIIWIPPDELTNDAAYAHEGRIYLERRGFPAWIILRDWRQVEHLLDIGWTRTVLVARACHWSVACMPRRVAEAPGKVIPLEGRRGRGGRHRAPGSPSCRIVRLGKAVRRPGDDGGFAERFLAARLQRSRHTGDT